MKPIKILFLLFILFGVLGWGKPTRGRPKKKNKKKKKDRDKDEIDSATEEAIRRSKEICELTQTTFEYPIIPTQAPTAQPTRTRARNAAKNSSKNKRKTVRINENDEIRTISDDDDDGERTETEEPQVEEDEAADETPDRAALMGQRHAELQRLNLGQLRAVVRGIRNDYNYDPNRRSSIIGAIMANEFPAIPQGPPPQPNMLSLSPEELLRRNPGLARDILGIVMEQTGPGQGRSIPRRKKNKKRGKKNKKGGKTTVNNSRKRPRDDERQDKSQGSSEPMDETLDELGSDDGTLDINLERPHKRRRSNEEV